MDFAGAGPSSESPAAIVQLINGLAARGHFAARGLNLAFWSNDPGGPKLEDAGLDLLSNSRRSPGSF